MCLSEPPLPWSSQTLPGLHLPSLARAQGLHLGCPSYGYTLWLTLCSMGLCSFLPHGTPRIHPAPGKASSFLQLRPRLRLTLACQDSILLMPRLGRRKQSSLPLLLGCWGQGR